MTDTTKRVLRAPEAAKYGDDPDGKLFAKFREGLDKRLRRQGIEVAAVWSRCIVTFNKFVINILARIADVSI